jgi:hypothetical protein
MNLNKKNSIIYITCPANQATGGPFLLHQLAFKLLQLGFNAKMFYSTENKNINPVHDFYKHFEVPYTFEIEDISNNILVVPETTIEFIFEYKTIRKVIWWLSVDNYFETHKKHSFSLKRFLGIKKKRYSYNFNKLPKHSHWVQSYYAEQFLKSKNLYDIDFLSDYLDPIFINEVKNLNIDFIDKKDIISYNPKKGYDITKELIKKAPHINWVPIENMTPIEVKELLIKSKIYIDFGNHPGKDRIPREAAMCGCIVITNKKGSAKYFEDVAIPESYKINYSAAEESEIISLLESCLANYEIKIKDFEVYKSKILNEEILFNVDLEKIISKFFI